MDDSTTLITFSSLIERRREVLINYAKDVGCHVLDIHEDLFGVPKEFGWLAQLVWGQQLALEISRALKTNPDTTRADQRVYNDARKAMVL